MPHPMNWYVREKIKVRLLRIHSGIKRRVYACYSSLAITLQSSVPSSQGWYFKIKCRTRIKTLGNESGYELSKETLCAIFCVHFEKNWTYFIRLKYKMHLENGSIFDALGLISQNNYVSYPRDIYLALIALWVIRSLQIFAHAMTPQLSWYVQNFIVITASEFGWQQAEISIKLDLWWGKSLVKWAYGYLIHNPCRQGIWLMSFASKVAFCMQWSICLVYISQWYYIKEYFTDYCRRCHNHNTVEYWFHPYCC